MMKIKHVVSMLCAALAVTTGLAHEGRQTSFDISWIADQHVLGVNKEEGHATFIPYESRATLMADERYERPWETPTKAMTLDLNGTWKFRWVKGTPLGPGASEFQAEDYDDSKWDCIRVPMSWEMDNRYNLPTTIRDTHIATRHPMPSRDMRTMASRIITQRDSIAVASTSPRDGATSACLSTSTVCIAAA